MARRFQFGLKSLFRWTTFTALILGALLSVTRLATYGPLPSDSALSLLYVALAITFVAAAIGAILDGSAIRGVLVGAGCGLALVTVLVLSCSQHP